MLGRVALCQVYYYPFNIWKLIDSFNFLLNNAQPRKCVEQHCRGNKKKWLLGWLVFISHKFFLASLIVCDRLPCELELPFRNCSNQVFSQVWCSLRVGVSLNYHKSLIENRQIREDMPNWKAYSFNKYVLEMFQAQVKLS